jgi:outer membrane protein assembly factor BamB
MVWVNCPVVLSLVRTALCLAIFGFSGATAYSEWPQYRHDAGRSGHTAETLPGQLTQAWAYRADHVPQPAWPRSDRLTFDRAIQPVIARGQVLFGDSVTGIVTAIDLVSGKTNWQFFTEGPVRFAPAVLNDRVFVTSDDGHLYALSIADGRPLWKHRGGPDHGLRLGNERMISRWPARGGAVIADDRVYYGAGIWPSDGIFLYALDPETGTVKWVNDSSGGLEMPQPHGGANAESGVAAQGYLVAADTTAGSSEEAAAQSWLLVATGRAVPAAFDRAQGQFQYFNLQKYGHKGGATIVASEQCFLNSGMIFDTATGESTESLGASLAVAVPQGVIRIASGTLERTEWKVVEKKDRKGNSYTARVLEPVWTAKELPAAEEMIAAGETAVIGAENEVLTVDGKTQTIAWRSPVEGRAKGLAVSDQCLVVSTDQGRIYCFQDARVINPTRSAQGNPEDSDNSKSSAPVDSEGAAISASDRKSDEALISAAVNRILQESKITSGYCLDLGCGDGQLSEELARNTDLHIVAVDSDPELVQQARVRLQKSKLLGARVTVLNVADLSVTGLPNYFANLIVSQRAVLQGSESIDRSEWERLQRPYGGVAMIGRNDAMERLERGPLKGAGQWTHQYSTPGNATCSTDELVKGPLGILWFRDIELDMPQRHGRGPGPLFYDGRLYSLGLNELACVDAYNGRLLWKYPLPGILKAYNGDELMGTAGTHSNYCIADSGLYVRRDGHCLRIDRITGQLMQQFEAPSAEDGKPGQWGFIAAKDGILIGTLADPEHVVTFRYVNRGGDMKSLLTESRSLFAMDAQSGQLLWKYDALASIRHNAIAFDGDGVYVIDRPVARFDREKNAKPDYHPTGTLLAFDAKTGKKRWESVQEIDGTLLALSEQHSALLMGSQPTRFALGSETGKGIAIFDPKTGDQRWRNADGYSSRPMINDQTIYAQGGAWDLLSGEKQPFDFSRSYGCGILAGSKHTMVFRSATLGYFDFERQQKTDNFGGIRPGCWINAIPAGGLVLVPDASAGCVCSYLNQSWFALEPDGMRSPEISPAGGAFREPVTVSITADDEASSVRYTVDGTAPGLDSPQFTGSLCIDSSTLVKTRAFDQQGRAGRISEAQFVIDASILPVDPAHWKVWDVSGDAVAGAPSDWVVKDGVVHQRSNIYQGSAAETDSKVERYGTLRLLSDDPSLADGTFELEMRCDDDDSVGVVFRCQDERHHYLFTSDRQRGFSLLAVKNGDEYRVLAVSDRSYQPGKWHQVGIQMQGSRLQIAMDGDLILETDDPTFALGTVGLHSWGSDKVQFRNLRIKGLTAP